MKQDTTGTEIVNKLYAAYGSGSGVLFGITDKAAVEAIVNFAVDYSATLPEQEHPDLPTEKKVTGDKSIEGLEWSWTNSNNSDYIDIDGDYRICSIPCDVDTLAEQEITKEQAIENAARIVKAVNNHSQLLIALENLVKYEAGHINHVRAWQDAKELLSRI